MSKVKKPDAMQQVTLPNGDIRIDYINGTSELIKKDNPSGLPTLTEVDKLVEDLKKDPKSRLLQDAAKIYLVKLKEAEFDKTTFKEWYDKIAELVGATQIEQHKDDRVTQIHFHVAPSRIQATDITARVIQSRV